MRDRSGLLVLVAVASVTMALPFLAPANAHSLILADNGTTSTLTNSTSTATLPPPPDENIVIIYSVGVLGFIVVVSAIAWLTRPKNRG